MVTHLAFITKIGKKQKTLASNNKERGKAKSTQKKQKHTYLITDRHTFLTPSPPNPSNSFSCISCSWEDILFTLFKFLTNF